MKKSTQPYFHFDGNCREAMEFYKDLFGGELNLMIVSESPMKEQFSAEVQYDVLHSSLVNGDFEIMASDMCGMGKLVQGNAVETNLDCSSEKEINRLYKGLSENGTVESELQEQFWGALFAQVTDKFGVRWMLNMEIKKG